MTTYATVAMSASTSPISTARSTSRPASSVGREGPRGRLCLPRRRRPTRAHALEAVLRLVRDRSARAAPPVVPGRGDRRGARRGAARPRARARFHHDGVVPHGEGASSGGIFFEDPDGIRLEIYTATGADAHQAGPERRPDLRVLLGHVARGRARGPGTRGRRRDRGTSCWGPGTQHPSGRARVPHRAALDPARRDRQGRPPVGQSALRRAGLRHDAGREHVSHIAAHPLPGDPLTHIPGAVGALALEPATERRMRLNGHATTDATGSRSTLEQVYSNCPKYIAKRHPMPRAANAIGTRAAASTTQPSACSRRRTRPSSPPARGGSRRLAPRRPSRGSSPSTTAR